MKTVKIIISMLILIGLFVAASPSKDKKIPEVKYEPTWKSLSQYGEAPEWFRDAKFGIWAHWGPQCVPEAGDWYARGMYDEGSWQYNYHIEKYGHPSEFGFKDVINLWKAEKWQPEKLMALYKKAGAKYFFTMGNHHDNFDMWNSKYQKWNSVNIGPKRDIVGEWEKVVRANGLYFGISIHSAHAWTWMETAQRSDKKGAKAGIPYDGKLTEVDGKGTWWEGYDPQELYAQNHALSSGSEDVNRIHSQWGWGNDVSVPDTAYCQNFLDRNIDVIDTYNPDLMYYDDTSMPLWPISDVGLKTVAHFYNNSIKKNKGRNEAVVFAKILTEEQKESLVWDVEKGVPDQIQPKPWQTCTCLGSWHYDRGVYDRNQYKSAQTVIHMLIDIISKNGNLLLSVPMRGDGTIDEKEEAILNDIAAWMDVNKEGIFGTRPWKIFGEGPVAETVIPLHAQGFNEGKHKPYTSEDIRFVTKGNILYAHAMAWPADGKILIKSLATNSPYSKSDIKKVELIGVGKVVFKKTAEGLLVTLPVKKPNDISLVLKIS